MHSDIIASLSSHAIRTGGALPPSPVTAAALAAQGSANTEFVARVSPRAPIGKRVPSSPTQPEAPVEPVLRRGAVAPQGTLAEPIGRRLPDLAKTTDMSAPRGCPPVQWEQAIGLARHTCAKVYRDGGSPAEALFSAGADNSADASWDTAIRALARQFCQR